jgi:hypothetical protein
MARATARKRQLLPVLALGCRNLASRQVGSHPGYGGSASVADEKLPMRYVDGLAVALAPVWVIGLIRRRTR